MSSLLFGAFTPKKPHLVTGPGGQAAEILELRQQIDSAFSSLESGGGLLRTSEFTNPVTADTDAIKTSFATTATLQDFGVASLNGVVGDDEMVPPRNPTITSSLHADVTAVGVIYDGLIRDARGNLVAQTDTIVVTAGGGVTDAAVKPFSKITRVRVPAMAGPGGLLEIGFGVSIGLSAKVKSRAGLLKAVREIVDGAVVTTGVITNPALSAAALYTPAAAPNGAHDYAVTFEVDPS